jgi:hypothetical protein
MVPTVRLLESMDDLIYLLDEDVEVLNRFSVAFRDPGVTATPDEARDARGRLERVFAALLPLLEPRLRGDWLSERAADRIDGEIATRRPYGRADGPYPG